MSNHPHNNQNIHNDLKADCANCFGLCCVALPYAKSADFAFDKEGGTSCSNLQADYRCGIHSDLRKKGFKGCTVYECFGAGQKVSQITYKGKNWRDNKGQAKEMFDVFPIMQQLHEMLLFLHEARSLEVAKPLINDLQVAIEKTDYFTTLSPKSILELDVLTHRAFINELLLRTSELVRAKAPQTKNKKQQHKIKRGSDYIGAKLKGADLSGSNLRGALLIAADLRESDMRMTDLIGADLRDADLSGANLTGSIFLTQAQINSAKGDSNTRLPYHIKFPEHWDTGRG